MTPQQHIAAAARCSDGDWRWHYTWTMTAANKEAVDTWLVDIGDPLAAQAGTSEWRFEMKVNEYRKSE